MPQPVYVMLPCRAGSQRIPEKNTRPFDNLAGGLLELKLRQLAGSKNIEGVVVSTDDAKVIEIAEDLRSLFGTALNVIPRPHELAISDSLDTFVSYVPTIMPKGVVFWTHVTSPFFGSQEIDLAVDMYRREVELGENDSLMGVTRIQTFLWNDQGCISHDRAQVKWPQTQDLKAIYEVNSSVFMIKRDEMARRLDRIGEKPFLMKMEKLTTNPKR
jgi:CMP-N-acetylneuraminic acid synthetase